MVEFAVAASLMFAVLFGLIQLGLLLYSYHAVANAARLGARWASVRGNDCVSTTCPTTAANVESYVLTQVPGLYAPNVVLTSPAPTWATPTWTSSPSACSATEQNAGCVVTVTVNYTFPFRWLFTAPAITSSSQVVVK